MKTLIRIAATLALAAGCGGCFGDTGQYLHRTDAITLTAGNANETNATTHIRDPWPAAAYNRNIPGNGSRMVGAVNRYEGTQATRGQGQGGTQPAQSEQTAPGVTPPATGAAVPSSTMPY